MTPAAFSFQKRRGKLEWRKMAKIDLDRVSREVDIDTLEAHLENLAFGNLTEDDLHWFTESNFSKLFRVLQMTVEYLLYVQEHLHGRNISLEAMLAEAEQRHSVTQARLHEQAEYVGALEQQLRNARISGVSSGRQPTEACPVCRKAFLSIGYLHAHMRRRHPDAPLPPASAAAPPPVASCQPCAPTIVSAPPPMMVAPAVDPSSVGEAVQAAVGVAMTAAKGETAAEIRHSLHAQLRDALPALAHELRDSTPASGEDLQGVRAQLEAQLHGAQQAQHGLVSQFASQAEELRMQIASVQDAVRSSEARLGAQLEARVGAQVERAASVVAEKAASEAVAQACGGAALSAHGRYAGQSKLGELEEGEADGGGGGGGGGARNYTAPLQGAVSEADVARRLQQQEEAMREMVAAQLAAAQQRSATGDDERRAAEAAAAAAREAELTRQQEELRRALDTQQRQHAEQLQALQAQQASSLRELQEQLRAAPSAADGADPRVAALEARLAEQEAAEQEARQEAQRAQEVTRKLDKERARLEAEGKAALAAVEAERAKAHDEIRRAEAAAEAAKQEAATQRGAAAPAAAAPTAAMPIAAAPAATEPAAGPVAEEARTEADTAPPAAETAMATAVRKSASAAPAAAKTSATAPAAATHATAPASGPPRPPPDAKAPAGPPASAAAASGLHRAGAQMASERGFEHSAADWEREREETLGQLDEELAKWKLTGRSTMSDLDLERWTAAFRANSQKTSSFDTQQTALARRKVERQLSELVSSSADFAAAGALSGHSDTLAPTTSVSGRSDATEPYPDSTRQEPADNAAVSKPSATPAGAPVAEPSSAITGLPAQTPGAGAPTPSGASGGVHTFNASTGPDSPPPHSAAPALPPAPAPAPTPAAFISAGRPPSATATSPKAKAASPAGEVDEILDFDEDELSP